MEPPEEPPDHADHPEDSEPEYLHEVDGEARPPVEAAAPPPHVAPMPPPPPPPIEGPCKYGYYRCSLTREKMMRKSGPLSGNSMAIQCYRGHGSRCSVAMADWKVPTDDELKTWILSTRAALPEETAASKEALRLAHIASLKELRDEVARRAEVAWAAWAPDAASAS